MEERIFVHEFYGYFDLVVDLGGAFFAVYLVVILPYRYVVGLSYMANLVTHVQESYEKDAEDLKKYKEIYE